MKRFIAAAVLVVLPVLAVQSVKQTEWASARVAPAFRHKGDPKAPVVILEFSDFQCPACAHIAPFVKDLLNKYDGKARLVFKYYPLSRIHPNAIRAAESAECAGAQDRFWPYHDRLFETQKQWATLSDATTSFMAIASEVGVDRTRFETCLNEGQAKESVLTDLVEAEAREIRSTPTFFVGNERLVGNAFAADGARMIERELRK